MIDVSIEPAPAIWASYLINADCSGIDQKEIEAADRWLASIAPAYPVDCEGEAYFSYSYGWHGGTATGGDLIDYILHQERKAK